MQSNVTEVFLFFFVFFLRKLLFASGSFYPSFGTTTGRSAQTSKDYFHYRKCVKSQLVASCSCIAVLKRHRGLAYLSDGCLSGSSIQLRQHVNHTKVIFRGMA